MVALKTHGEKHMTTERDVIVWREAIYEALLCVPAAIRGEVFKQIADKLAARQASANQMKAWTLEDMKAEAELKNEEWNAGENTELPPPRNARIFEAQSVIVQVLTRAIRNSHSPATAAAILFRQHRTGAGSRWLPDYLDGLPAIKIDRAKAAQIAMAEAPQS
jgi:hypothetical protein